MLTKFALARHAAKGRSWRIKLRESYGLQYGCAQGY